MGLGTDRGVELPQTVAWSSGDRSAKGEPYRPAVIPFGQVVRRNQIKHSLRCDILTQRGFSTLFVAQRLG